VTLFEQFIDLGHLTRESRTTLLDISQLSTTLTLPGRCGDLLNRRRRGDGNLGCDSASLRGLFRLHQTFISLRWRSRINGIKEAISFVV